MGWAGLPLLLALQGPQTELQHGLTFTTAPLILLAKGQGPAGPAVLSDSGSCAGHRGWSGQSPALIPAPASPHSLTILGITAQRICLSPTGRDWPLQRLKQLLVRLTVNNLQFRLKKLSDKTTSLRPECAHFVPSCCSPTTTSYPEGLDSPAVIARLQDSRGSSSSHTPWMRKLKIPPPGWGRWARSQLGPDFPSSSCHHSPPITKKLCKDNLDVFIVFLFTNHKAGQKAECEHGTRASDTFIK